MEKFIPVGRDQRRPHTWVTHNSVGYFFLKKKHQKKRQQKRPDAESALFSSRGKTRRFSISWSSTLPFLFFRDLPFTPVTFQPTTFALSKVHLPNPRLHFLPSCSFFQLVSYPSRALSHANDVANHRDRHEHQRSHCAEENSMRKVLCRVLNVSIQPSTRAMTVIFNKDHPRFSWANCTFLKNYYTSRPALNQFHEKNCSNNFSVSRLIYDLFQTLVCAT